MAQYDPTNPAYPVHPQQRKDFNPLVAIVLILVIALIVEIAWIALRGSKPLRAELAIRRGQAAMAGGRLPEAERYFKDALALKPNSPEAQFGLARVYEVTNRTDDLMKLYPSLIEHRPQDADLRIRHAYLLDSKRKYRSAERELRKALEIVPDHPGASNNLAYLYSEQNRNLNEALEMARKAVAAEPDQGFIWDTLGWIHYRLKNYRDAENALLKAFDFERQSYEAAHYHLGMVYVRMKRLKEAREHFQEIPQLSEFYRPSQQALKALDEGRIPTDEDKPAEDVTTAMRALSGSLA